MAKKQNAGVKFLNFVIILITVLATMIDFGYIYFTTIGKDKVPTGLTTSYVSSITDPQTKEEMTVMKVNVLSNEVNNGLPMVEFMINSYTDTAKSAVIGIGFQLVGDELYFYNRTNSGSFQAVTEFDQQNSVFLIDIDEQLFALKLDGTYQVPVLDGWKIVRTIGTLALNTLWEGPNFEILETRSYTIKEFMEAIRNTVVSNSNGTGEGILSLVDVSQYFNLYDATTNEQISNEELGNYGLTRSYFDVEYSYSKAGVNWAEQSLFGSVAGDSDYNTSSVDANKDYWQAVSHVELTEEDFERRTSALNEMDYLYLTANAIDKMNINTAVEIYISINLDDDNIAGFDYYALANLKNVKKIEISSTNAVEFEILNGALNGTNFDVEDILASNVTLTGSVMEVA